MSAKTANPQTEDKETIHLFWCHFVNILDSNTTQEMRGWESKVESTSSTEFAKLADLFFILSPNNTGRPTNLWTSSCRECKVGIEILETITTIAYP